MVMNEEVRFAFGVLALLGFIGLIGIAKAFL